MNGDQSRIGVQHPQPAEKEKARDDETDGRSHLCEECEEGKPAAKRKPNTGKGIPCGHRNEPGNHRGPERHEQAVDDAPKNVLGQQRLDVVLDRWFEEDRGRERENLCPRLQRSHDDPDHRESPDQDHEHIEAEDQP